MTKTVVIDAGHGLPDPGAIGYGQEHTYALEISREVAKRLPASVKVIYTRYNQNALDEDKSRDLKARCSVSNRNNADLFVSIHLNAFNKQASGYETLVYSSDAQDKIVHAEIAKVLKKHNVVDRGIKKRDNVYVLHGTKAKALLLECLFVDNKADMDKLNNQTFFAEFCQSIADGIAKAVGVAPKSTQAASVTPGKYRIFTGVFDSKEAAEEAAALIRDKVGLNPFIRKEE